MDLLIRKKRHKHFDITPLIDIIFNIFLFFILTYQVSKYNSIEITLPKSKLESSNTAKNPEIIINNKKEIFFNNEKVDINELSKKITPYSSKYKAIDIKSDDSVDIKTLINVVDEIKTSGFDDFNIITEKK